MPQLTGWHWERREGPDAIDARGRKSPRQETVPGRFRQLSLQRADARTREATRAPPDPFAQRLPTIAARRSVTRPAPAVAGWSAVRASGTNRALAGRPRPTRSAAAGRHPAARRALAVRRVRHTRSPPGSAGRPRRRHLSRKPHPRPVATTQQPDVLWPPRRSP